jgi:hypothetical protein
MRHVCVVGGLLAVAGVGQAGIARAQALPAVAELRARGVASYKQSEAARERYLCRESIENQELDGSGRVKKTDHVEREIFFVNGFEISQEVTKDGKPLSAEQQKKRDEAVAKAVASAAERRQPKTSGVVISGGDILRLGRLENERRVLVAGRPTIVFDVVDDPKAKTTSLEQKLVAAMDGTVSVDEATGNLQDVNTRGVRDVKVGGGMLANIHKGFAVHLVIAPQADGVWLLKLAEGTGDARVGMFLHAGLRFRQETEGCQLYDVSTQQAGDTARETKQSPK